MKKIRLDFVTNSSSTCYLITLKKKGTDEEILKELEELSGYGPKGAQEVFDSFEDYDEEHCSSDDYFGEGAVSVSVITSSTEDRGPVVADVICGQLFSDDDYKGKHLEVLEVGDEDCC